MLVCWADAACESSCGCPYAGQAELCSLPTAQGGDLGAVEQDVSPTMLVARKAMAMLVLLTGLDKRCVDRQTVNISFLKKKKTTVRCNWKTAPYLLSLSNYFPLN